MKDAVVCVRGKYRLSVRRLARVFEVHRSSIGRWIGPKRGVSGKPRRLRPVTDNREIRQKVQRVCLSPREHQRGHRMVRALLRRRFGLHLSRKSVLRIMRELKLTRPRKRYKPKRPKRVVKMRPTAPNQAWQIDMTSFQLSNFRPVFLVTVIDCFTRQIVGWTMDQRCRAKEWSAAVREALESRGLIKKSDCQNLVLRSDNGAQPCSRKFTQFLKRRGVVGQYTGYNAPDDNAFVERVIRTIKDEEIWISEYDRFSEARQAIARYIQYYNSQRIHSALDYRTPDEVFHAATFSLNAA